MLIDAIFSFADFAVIQSIAHTKRFDVCSRRQRQQAPQWAVWPDLLIFSTYFRDASTRSKCLGDVSKKEKI